MSKAALFLVNGFEEVEAIAPLDILRRGKVWVDTISLTGEEVVTGSHSVKCTADFLYEKVMIWDYEMLIMPGGPGTEKYLGYKEFIERIKASCRAGVKIAAICAAPSVLGRLSLLKGLKVTCHPGYEKYLEGAEVVWDKVITDKNITTSQGMGTSLDFGFELLRILKSRDVSDEVRKNTVYENR